MPDDSNNNAPPPPVTTEFVIARLVQAYPQATGEQLSLVADALQKRGAVNTTYELEAALTTRAPAYMSAMGAGRGAPARTDTGQFAPPAPTQAAPAQPPLMPAPTGTGAGSHTLPEDPALLTTAQVDAMSPTEARDFYERWKTRAGVFRHPWAPAREQEAQKRRDLTDVERLLRDATSKQRTGR